MLARVSQSPIAGSQFDTKLAKQFVWLLREDLRNAFQTVDNPAFGDWWLIKGRQDYPAWAHTTSAQELHPLFESAGKATIAGVSLEVPKVVQLLARYRGDAVREFTQNGKLDHEKFFAWAIVRGFAEHHLGTYSPLHLQAILDRPVLRKHAENDKDTPAITLLMYLLWSLMDEATQKALNIFTAKGSKAYLPWFFNVVLQLNIGPLIAGRWKSWVKAQPSYKGPQLAWAIAAPEIHEPNSYSKKEKKPFGVNLYGFAYGELGIGEDLRMAVASCEASNIPYYVVNVDAGSIRQSDNYLKGKTNDIHNNISPPYRNNIFCLPAFDTISRIYMEKGANAFEGYHNIGWWPWELNVFPKAWQKSAFEIIDEVWASSRFLESMYKNSTDKPVHYVPLAVSVDRMVPFSREYFNLPTNDFLFLYVFDYNSSVERKNPIAAVKAFKKAFDNEIQNVGMVLKTMNINKKNDAKWKEFIEECKTDKRIHVLIDTMDRTEVLGLINSCDAYVSPHRAEGFGRTIAEAILLGKPVIVTDYSGSKDFSHSRNYVPVEYEELLIKSEDYHWIENSDYAKWAEISIYSAAKAMKKIQKYRKNKYRTSESDLFSTKKTGNMMKKLLS